MPQEQCTVVIDSPSHSITLYYYVLLVAAKNLSGRRCINARAI